jgi:hypothetical protein
MSQISTNIVKNYITEVVLPDYKDQIVETCKNLKWDIFSMDLSKGIIKKNDWKRVHKCKIDDKTRRVFTYEESGLYVDPAARGQRVLPSKVLTLAAFDLIIAVYTDKDDNNIIGHELLYIGEHEWEEDYYKKVI